LQACQVPVQRLIASDHHRLAAPARALEGALIGARRYGVRTKHRHGGSTLRAGRAPFGFGHGRRRHGANHSVSLPVTRGSAGGKIIFKRTFGCLGLRSDCAFKTRPHRCERGRRDPWFLRQQSYFLLMQLYCTPRGIAGAGATSRQLPTISRICPAGQVRLSTRTFCPHDNCAVSGSLS